MPSEIVVPILIAAASAIAKDLATPAVKSLFQGIKSLLTDAAGDPISVDRAFPLDDHALHGKGATAAQESVRQMLAHNPNVRTNELDAKVEQLTAELRSLPTAELLFDGSGLATSGSTVDVDHRGTKAKVILKEAVLRDSALNIRSDSRPRE